LLQRCARGALSVTHLPDSRRARQAALFFTGVGPSRASRIGREPLIAVPAFLTLVLIPLTYSIANGLGFGIISWAVLQLATGRFRRQDWLLYVLAALFLTRFIYLGAS